MNITRKEKSISEVILRDDEYRDESGEIRCVKCNEPRYIHKSEDGRRFFAPMPIMCACMRKQREKEMESARIADRQKHVDSLRKKAFFSDVFHDVNFSKDDGKNQKISNAMKRYVENFGHFREIGKGLLLHGSVGTGKTFYAVCISNALIDREHSVKFVTLSRMINDIMETFEGRQAKIDALTKYDLVVLDDMGAERSTQSVADYTLQIIDVLYQSKTPVICTTNLSIEDIKNPQTFEQRRIYDRMMEMCFPIEIKGENKRRTNIIESFDGIKDILEL